MQAQNTFNDGMVLDNHPLMTPNTVLTNALNATIVTMNGNEGVLQNDMGNARIDNAKLPPGYIPIGMKEYGGIIYVACYNPITNKGQIGCFPSPQRQHTATQISELTPIFKFPDITEIENNGYYNCVLNSIISKCEIFPKGTIIRSGDKFAVGLPIKTLFGGDNWQELASKYISNCNNVLGQLVATPMNRMFTFGVATLDNNGQLNDITNQLKRYDLNTDNCIQFSNKDSDLYKFNVGYWQKSINSDNTDGVTELEKTTELSTDLNTYNSKLFGRLFLYAKYNVIDSLEVSIVGYKKLFNDDQITNPADNSSLSFEDSNLMLLVNLTYKYNCPDGSRVLEDNKTLRDTIPVEPLEGYAYYFDNPNIARDENENSIIKGALLTLKSSKGSFQYMMDFKIPTENNLNYLTGYGYPIYDKLTNLYTFSQIYPINLNINGNIDFSYNVTPIMRLRDGDHFIPIDIPGLDIDGNINSDNFNTGLMKLNTWNYYIDNNSVKLRWGFNSEPRESDNFSNVTFDFYDVSQNYELDNNGDIINGTPRWTYTTKNRISYNGTFSENFDINNFIDSKAISKNLILPNTLFYVKISWSNNDKISYEYRWLLLSKLYNTSYWGDDTYDAIQDYNDFINCYFTYKDQYYYFSKEAVEIEICTQDNKSIITSDNQFIVAEDVPDSNATGQWVTTSDEELIKNKLRIPSEYFILNIESRLTKTNSPSKLIKQSTDNYLFTTNTESKKSIYVTYKTQNTISNSVELVQDSTHGINLNSFIPSLTGINVTESNDASIGNSIQNNLVSGTISESSYNNNIFNFSYNYTCKQLLQGNLGEIKCNLLNTLDTLPTIQDLVIKENDTFKWLNNSYAFSCGANNDGKCDFLIQLIRIGNDNKYTGTPQVLQNFKSTDYHHHHIHLGYDKIISSSGGRQDDSKNETIQNALLDYIPEEESIIIIRGVGPMSQSDKNNYPADAGSYNYKYTVHRVTFDDESAPRDCNHLKGGESESQREYLYNFIVLIRDINGRDFTVVNYITEQKTGVSQSNTLPLSFNSSTLKTNWDNFINSNFKNYVFYNSTNSPENTIYSVINNQEYSNKYNVNLAIDISATLKDEDYQAYNNILSNYNNITSYLPILSKNSNVSINQNLKIATVDSPLDLIEEINNTEITAYIDSNQNIIQKDINGNPLNSTDVYHIKNSNNTITLQVYNNLVIQNGNLYTKKITRSFNSQECYYGISSRRGSTTAAVTFGYAPYINLYSNEQGIHSINYNSEKN